ncbi:MAG: transglutaminase domain-containing protein [Candidatus Hydrogenedentes bacterium]|nr:transglutaminase domain-containing protein [Candidatus Hydrogenedentota bacterium]
MLRRFGPKLIPVAIVLFWLIMMALLIRHEFLVPYLNPGTFGGAAYSDVPTETWMGVYLPGDQPVGYVQVATRPEPHGDEPGTRLHLNANIRMQLFGEETRVAMDGSAWTSADRGMSEFNFGMRSGGHALRVTGAVEAGMLKALVHTGGETIPIEWPVKDELILWSGWGMTELNMPALKPGKEYFVESFDPTTLSLGRARLECVGQERIELNGGQVDTKVVSIEVAGVVSKAWVADSGEVVRAETPFGFTLQRAAPEVALRNLSGEASGALLQLAAVPVSGPTPFRGARRMVVRLGRRAGDAAPDSPQPPSDDVQHSDGDGQYTIIVPAEPAGAEAQALDAEAAREHLASGPLVQADHPRIQALAARIAPEGADPWARACAIYNWVYTSIDKVPVLSLPSALDVLDTREGDCNEHTVLFTALARAAGIPARIAIGVVWSEDLKSFYYHAWPEVYVGQWVWMEPTLGQPVADATHIKLLAGDIQRWTELLPYLGQLTVEVIEIE